MGSCIQLQQRNCSRFKRDFLRRSTNQARKELRSGIATRVYLFKDFLTDSKMKAVVQPPFAGFRFGYGGIGGRS